MKWVLLLLTYYFLCSVSNIFAFDDVTLKLGSITGSGWHAEGVIAKLNGLEAKQSTLSLEIATLSLPKLKIPLQKLSLNCQHAEYKSTKISCSNANLSIGGNLLDKPITNLAFAYHFDSQRIDFKIDNFTLAGSVVNLKVKFIPNDWQASLNINNLKLDKLLTQLNSLINLPPDLLTLAGKTTLAIELSGDPDLRSISIDGQATNLRFFTDVEQTQGGEDITLRIAIKAEREKILQKSSEKFLIQGNLTVKKGGVCVDILCVEFVEQPMTTTISLLWYPQHLQINHFDYTHTNIMTIRGTGKLELDEEWDVNTLSVQLIPYSLQQIYTNYLQGVLDNFLDEESQFNELEVSGNIKASLNLDKDNYQVVAQLDNVNVEDQNNFFGVQGIRGKIQWHNKAKNLPSHLHWSSGYFISDKIKLGASQLRVNLSNDRIRLLAPWYQPILNGAVRVKQFSLKNIGKENMAGQITDGKLYPISLRTLSTAVDGPPVSGQISGEIPLINYQQNCVLDDSYHEDCLEIGGELQMRIFDGDVVAHSLSLLNILTEEPTLKADIDITNLNLATLTKEIEFGRIEGQLSGHIRELHLVNWEPVSFDAHFATPEDDKSPHKISQKAIKNLSNLGGGAAVNVISYSVLNIFQEFYYQRMGLGCHLKNGVCKMKGVGKIQDGYYIIKGNWLPRIDMIGYNKNKVDWNKLMDRIKTVINTADTLIVE